MERSRIVWSLKCEVYSIVMGDCVLAWSSRGLSASELLGVIQNYRIAIIDAEERLWRDNSTSVATPYGTEP